MIKSDARDIAIIGAGPVGLFAIFECGMLNMRAHVFDALTHVGGQCIALYPEKPIFDIPAHPRILGADLAHNLEAQAAPFDPIYHLGQNVTGIKRLPDNRWEITSSTGNVVHVGAIIIAAGVGAFGPNRPPLERLEEFEGKSVFYYVSKKEDYRGKKVVIAGGGDSAVDWALSLYDIAARVSVVHRRPKFRAAPASESQLHALAQEGKIDLIIPYQLERLEGGDGTLSAVIVKDLDNKERTIEADILLPFYGLSMNLGPILEWGLMHERQNIVVDPATAGTSVEGIYAIGDVAHYPGKLKLILQGFSEAAVAAYAIQKLLYPNKEFHFEYSTTKGVPNA